MSILQIPCKSSLDIKLEELWYDIPFTRWTDFIKELDKNIIDVKVIRQDNGVEDTFIEFVKKEHISWFLVRWS